MGKKIAKYYVGMAVREMVGNRNGAVSEVDENIVKIKWDFTPKAKQYHILQLNYLLRSGNIEVIK